MAALVCPSHNQALKLLWPWSSCLFKLLPFSEIALLIDALKAWVLILCRTIGRDWIGYVEHRTNIVITWGKNYLCLFLDKFPTNL